MQNSPAKFCFFPERASIFHNNSPVILHYSLATTILNKNPDRDPIVMSCIHQMAKSSLSIILLSLVICKMLFFFREKMLHLGVEQNGGRPVNSQVIISPLCLVGLIFYFF